MQVRLYGLGTTKDLLPEIVIPPRKSKPCCVAVHHGENAPALFPYMNPFLKEAMALHPLSSKVLTGGRTRAFALRVRCIIGDAKERAWLKGTLLAF